MANEAAQKLFAGTAGGLAGTSIHRYLPSLLNLPSAQHEGRTFRTVMQCHGTRHNGEEFLTDICFSTYKTSVGARIAAMVVDISEDLRPHELSLKRFFRKAESSWRFLLDKICHKEIGQKLDISEGSVKAVLQQLFARAGVREEASWYASPPKDIPWTGGMSTGHLVSWIFGLFAVLGLALAAVGLYSVVSYTVAQRTNEFGIRMALGAGRGHVLRIVFASTLVSVGGGVLGGLALTLGLNKIVAQWADGNAHDPIACWWDPGAWPW